MQTNNNIYKIKSAGGLIKDIDEKKGIVTGWLSQFENIDKVKEVVDGKAFNKTLTNKNINPVYLFNHNWDNMIGSFDVIKPDSYGLYYEKDMLKTYEINGQTISNPEAKKILIGVIEKVLTKNSFGYKVISSIQEKASGVEYTRLTEIELYEGSILSVEACNDGAIVSGLKSLSNNTDTLSKIKDLQENINSMLKTKMTKDKYQVLKMKNLQLSQLIADYQIELKQRKEIQENRNKVKQLYNSILNNK